MNFDTNEAIKKPGLCQFPVQNEKAFGSSDSSCAFRFMTSIIVF
jgi:hypothetical protein